MRFYARILPCRAAFLRKSNGTALCGAAICYFAQQSQRIAANFVHFLHCFAAAIEKNKYHGKLEVRQLGGGVPPKKNCGGIIMFEKIRNLKNKKGFTLVELIVVLVILAILAALLVPALTGYIKRAKEQSIIAETRQTVMAAQTLISEAYAKNTTSVDADVKWTAGTTGTTDGSLVYGDITINETDIKALSEQKGSITEMTVSKDGKIVTLTYSRGQSCTYTAANADPYKVS